MLAHCLEGVAKRRSVVSIVDDQRDRHVLLCLRGEPVEKGKIPNLGDVVFARTGKAHTQSSRHASIRGSAAGELEAAARIDANGALSPARPRLYILMGR